MMNWLKKEARIFFNAAMSAITWVLMAQLVLWLYEGRITIIVN